MRNFNFAPSIHEMAFTIQTPLQTLKPNAPTVLVTTDLSFLFFFLLCHSTLLWSPQEQKAPVIKEAAKAPKGYTAVMCPGAYGIVVKSLSIIESCLAIFFFPLYYYACGKSHFFFPVTIFSLHRLFYIIFLTSFSKLMFISDPMGEFDVRLDVWHNFPFLFSFSFFFLSFCQ